MIVALDGPAASGKGTIARRISQRFGFAHLDTGLLYRFVARRLGEAEGNASPRSGAIQIARGLNASDLGDLDLLRAPEIDELASTVAAWPEVRAAVLACQRQFAANPPGDASGAVLDGRDIGSVVCPDADLKVFVTAEIQTRARRRVKELADRGVAAKRQDVLAALRARDARDRDRTIAPLRKADDAHLLDTTDLDIETAVERVSTMIVERLESGRN